MANILYTIYINPLPTSNYSAGCSWLNWAPGPDADEAALKIAQGAYNYGLNDAAYKFRERQKVYGELVKEPSLYANDTILFNFVALMETSPIHKIIGVREDMSLGDFEAAILKNQEIISQEQFVINRKTVDGLYLNRIATGQPFTSTDSTNLLNIALLNPFIGGDAVYSARVLLGIDAMDYGIEYRNNGSLVESKTPGSGSPIYVKVYPNPSSARVVLDKVLLLDQQLEFVLYNIYGKEVLRNNLNELSQSLSIENLSTGVYPYKIFLGQQLLQQDKIVKLSKN